MIRTALRLSTVAALQAGGVEPYPTLAGAHVFDSRQDDITDIAAGDRRPVIVVRTDQDRRAMNAGATATRAPVGRTIDLRVEISVVAALKDETTGDFMVGWPATDAGLEALLDLMEWQVEAALRGRSAWALWWDGLWARASVTSTPIFTAPAEGNVRLAARELAMTMVSLPFDCLPAAVRDDDPLPAATLDPRLLAVFARIAADGGGDLKSAAAQIRAALEARALPAASVHPALEKVWLTIPEAAPPPGETPAAAIEAEISGPLPTP